MACEDAALSSGVFIATTASLVALWVATMTIFGILTVVLCWRNHKLKQNGSQTIMQCTFSTYTVIMLLVFILFLSVSHQKSPSPPLPPFGTPSGDPALSGDPTPSVDPSTIQLQPNPSYCLLEMSHQQLMSSRLEDETKYINL